MLFPFEAQGRLLVWQLHYSSHKSAARSHAQRDIASQLEDETRDKDNTMEQSWHDTYFEAVKCLKGYKLPVLFHEYAYMFEKYGLAYNTHAQRSASFHNAIVHAAIHTFGAFVIPSFFSCIKTDGTVGGTMPFKMKTHVLAHLQYGTYQKNIYMLAQPQTGLFDFFFI